MARNRMTALLALAAALLVAAPPGAVAKGEAQRRWAELHGGRRGRHNATTSTSAVGSHRGDGDVAALAGQKLSA